MESKGVEKKLEGLALMVEDNNSLTFHIEAKLDYLYNINMCIVKHFVIEKSIKVYVMKDSLTCLWKPMKGVAIIEAYQGLFMFQFYHKLKMKKAFNSRPWFFDNNLLVIRKIQPREVPNEVALFHTPFWFQAHNIPVDFMTDVVGQHLGNFVGKFIVYDENNNKGGWKKYMRI